MITTAEPLACDGHGLGRCRRHSLFFPLKVGSTTHTHEEYFQVLKSCVIWATSLVAGGRLVCSNQSIPRAFKSRRGCQCSRLIYSYLFTVAPHSESRNAPSSAFTSVHLLFALYFPFSETCSKHICHLGFKHHTVHNTSHHTLLPPQQSISSVPAAGGGRLVPSIRVKEEEDEKQRSLKTLYSHCWKVCYSERSS